jgi:hypothetical protein
MNHDTMLAQLDELYIDYDGETTFGDYTINVQRDDDPMNPRVDWDNLGTMVCWHRNYNLGDNRHGYETPNVFVHVLSCLYSEEATEYLTDEQIDRCWAEVHKKNVVLPLYLYDHSGITMSTTGFSCPWDSGQVGYIYISLEDIRKEYNWKLVTKTRRKQIEKYLTGEVEVYDHYLTGSVYGYTITKGEDEEDVDSCWGYFGYHTDDDGYMLSCIKDAIKWDIKDTPQQIELPITQSSQLEMHV